MEECIRLVSFDLQLLQGFPVHGCDEPIKIHAVRQPLTVLVGAIPLEISYVAPYPQRPQLRSRDLPDDLAGDREDLNAQITWHFAARDREHESRRCAERIRIVQQVGDHGLVEYVEQYPVIDLPGCVPAAIPAIDDEFIFTIFEEDGIQVDAGRVVGIGSGTRRRETHRIVIEPETAKHTVGISDADTEQGRVIQR